ncbi:hypothetical protein BJV82DRAFT_200334 [Fennellomyces sp. T-0311]|nr:hypothetical protein BJV82DRAFT_200334 [Fennellomyces sp. T-0311]
MHGVRERNFNYSARFSLSMKRFRNHDNNDDPSKRQAKDRSFETVSTIDTISDIDDHPFGHVVGDQQDLIVNDESIIMSFDELQPNIVSHNGDPASDPICTFTDDDDDDGQSTHNYPQNILAGLDDWQPTPGFRHSTQTLEDDEILSSFPTEDEASQPFFDAANARIESAPVPDFRLKSASLPKIYPSKQEGNPKPLDFKAGGLAANTIERISVMAEDHAAWEANVRAEMARLGSIPRVCSLFDNASLFRIIECWDERGLVFGRCVRLRPDELEGVLGQNVAMDDDDLVSQPTVLPPYVPIEGEEEFTFLFSFAYLQSKAKGRFLDEECVGIWTPWTAISDGQRDIYVATRFMSELLY